MIKEHSDENLRNVRVRRAAGRSRRRNLVTKDSALHLAADSVCSLGVRSNVQRPASPPIVSPCSGFG